MSFEQAIKEVRELKVSPTNTELLQLYGLYKQATVGENKTKRPSFIDLKGCAKWDSWNDNKKLSKEEAQVKYVSLVSSLKSKYSK